MKSFLKERKYYDLKIKNTKVRVVFSAKKDAPNLESALVKIASKIENRIT